ncbi:MAG: 5-oxoprolinase subunit PxpB [Saprospiraceae bacterium]|nr:5-oxoprolinase subunit PxpB [Saprospiraceae bacterium]
MKIKPFGEAALLVEWEATIAPEIHQQVVDLQAQITSQLANGITFIIPAYCSLLVGFDPAIWERQLLTAQLRHLAEVASDRIAKPTRKLHIPVCYEQAPDREEVMALTGLDWSTFVEMHSRKTYRVYMLGFLPGFAYMGSLAPALNCPRKREPRAAVPAQSVAITGLQTGIYPMAAPGGWQLVGRCPIPIFSADDFLFQAGDAVQFYPVNEQEFKDIEQKIEGQTFNWEAIYG